MVRPTVTKDVPGCNNRFAPLSETYAGYQIRRSLEITSGKDPPPTQGRVPLPFRPSQLTPAQQLIKTTGLTSRVLHTRNYFKVKSSTFVKGVIQ
jgi:hypothetical protein